MKNQFDRKFLTGVAGGVFITLIFAALWQSSGASPQGKILAEIKGETLTRDELRKRVSSDLVPIENDEYRVLQGGVEEWLDTRLFEKEAKASGLTLEEFYKKEIWGKVQVSSNDTLDHYHKNRELFNQPFEQVSRQISEELRRAQYARVKQDLLKKLSEKYNAKIFLKKPGSYVEGLALPSTGLPGTAPPQVAPPLLPGVPAGPVEAKSEIGSPPSRGSAAAAITLTEFADFHCHFCKVVNPTLDKLMQTYAGKIRMVFRHFPLSNTPGAGSLLTHEASVCAQEQGKFWEFHDAVFEMPNSPQPADLDQIAQKINLNLNQFQECLKSGKYRDSIQKDAEEGTQKGVQGTPAVFVNDQLVSGAFPYEHFVNVVEGILNPGKAPIPVPGAGGGEPQPRPPAPPAPSARVVFDDLEGRPASGPKNAAVTLVEFSDFHCPFCQKVTPTLEQLVKNYPGKIRRVWRQYPLPFHAGADRTAEASECAHEQGKFWGYHDKLFETLGGPRDDAALISLAEQAGLNKKKFEKCLAGGKHKEAVQKDIAKGAQVGVQGTPAVFVNGQLVSGAYPYQYFSNLVEGILNPGKAPAPSPTPAPSPSPAPPAPSGPVSFNDLEGRPSLGPKDAPVTLVEFSDFFCPFCQRVTPTLEQLMTNYPGKIRRVWRHYPLPFHTGSDRSHEASECANEQGKFWEYHDKLFQNLGGPHDDAALISYAEQVNLDKGKFQQCLTSGKYKELIQKEIARGGQVGVQGTPAVFVNGQLVSGAYPYEYFDQIVKSELSKKS